MNTILDISILLNIIGVGQGIFLGILLLMKRSSQQQAYRLLALLLFVISVNILNSVIIFTQYAAIMPWYQGVSNAVSFAISPLIYLYVLSLTKRKSCLSDSLVLHFLPCLIILLLYVLNFFWNENIYKVGILPGLHQFLHGNLMKIIWNVHFGCYLLFSVREVWSYQLSVKKVFISPQPLHTTWIKIVLWGITFIWLINLILYMYAWWVSPLPEIVLLNISLLLSIFIFIIAYKAYYQTHEKLGKKYQNSALTEDMITAYLDKLVATMEIEKSYLNPNISLKIVAETTGIPARDLSRIINERFGQNFSDYINRYRIQEVKNLLSDPAKKNLTIWGIAQEAGFTSNSAFYKAFKKYTGMTPTEYTTQIPAAN